MEHSDDDWMNDSDPNELPPELLPDLAPSAKGPVFIPKKPETPSFMSQAAEALSKSRQLDWQKDDWNKQLDGLCASAAELRKTLSSALEWLGNHDPLKTWEEWKLRAIAQITGPLSAFWPSMPAGTDYSVQFGMHNHNHFYAWPPIPYPMPNFGPILWGTAPDVLINAKPGANMESGGLTAFCGGWAPIFSMKSGSSSVLVGGKRAVRMGDLVGACEVPDEEEDTTFSDLVSLSKVLGAKDAFETGKKLKSAYDATVSLLEFGGKVYEWGKAVTEFAPLTVGLELAKLQDELAKETDPVRRENLQERIGFTQTKMKRAITLTALGFVKTVAGFLTNPENARTATSLLRRFHTFCLSWLRPSAHFRALLLVWKLKRTLMPLITAWFRMASFITKVMEDKKVIDLGSFLLAGCSPNVFIGGIPFNDEWVSLSIFGKYLLHKSPQWLSGLKKLAGAPSFAI